MRNSIAGGPWKGYTTRKKKEKKIAAKCHNKRSLESASDLSVKLRVQEIVVGIREAEW
jgi:hypothetical protein